MKAQWLNQQNKSTFCGGWDCAQAAAFILEEAHSYKCVFQFIFATLALEKCVILDKNSPTEAI